MALSATIEQHETRPDEAADGGRSIPMLFWQVAAARAHRTAMRSKRFGIWQAVTWGDYAAAVQEVGCALLARGIGRGERIAILSGNRPEWLFADLAVQSVGCVSVGIDVAAPVDRIAEVLKDGGVRILFVDGTERLDAALAANVPTLDNIVHFDERVEPVHTGAQIVSFAAFRSGGRELHKRDPEQYKHAINAVGPDEIAQQVDALARAYPRESGDEQLSILPLSQFVERCFTIYRPLIADTVVNFGEGPANLLQSLREAAPHIVLATTEVFEELHATIVATIAESMRIDRSIYRFALGMGAAAADRRAKGLPLSPGLKLRLLVARLLVLNRVKTMIGLHRAGLLLSADGALSPALSAWYGALGTAVEVLDEIACKGRAAVVGEGWRPSEANGILGSSRRIT